MTAEVTPADVVAKAREFLNVRWRHQGRSLLGLDCAGMVVRVAQDLALSSFDWRAYGRMPQADRLRQVLLEAGCIELPPGTPPAPGLLALMKFEREPQHLAIVSDHKHGLGLIHALLWERRVVEHRVDDAWRRRIVALFELPNVRYGAGDAR